MNKVVLSADSTCDLSPELVEKYNVHIMPLSVVLGDEVRTDGVDVKTQDLFDYVAATGTLPKTSAVTLAAYEDFFTEMKEQGCDVVHIGLSSKFSSCVQNAIIAAEEVGNAVVIDSYNLSTGSGLLVVEAAEKIKEGCSAEEVRQYIESVIPKVDASFVIDAIPYLYKGGRCSATAAFGANLLKIKPCIEVQDGAMGVGKKYRGLMKEVVRQYAKDRLAQEGVTPVRKRVFVTHTCVHPELIDIVKNVAVESGLFDEVLVTAAGSTIASHCGPDCIGILFIRA